MNNLIKVALLFLLTSSFGCSNQLSDEVKIIENCEKVNSQALGMTVVVCADGSYYYTSQGFLGGCGRSEVEYLIYDVPIKIGQLSNVDNDDEDNSSNYRDVDFAKIDMNEQLQIEKQMLAGKTCRCKHKETEYVVKCIKADCNCETICSKAVKILDKELKK